MATRTLTLPAPRAGIRPSITASVTQVLPDGTHVVLRPLERDERAPVQQVFDGMSPRSRERRFLSPLPRLSESMLRRLTDVDQDRHVAWVATVDGRAVAVARYVRDVADDSTAEVAASVIDSHQGRGLGRLLLCVLGAVATATGVSRFTYLIEPTNSASRAWLAPVLDTEQVEDGVIEASGPVPVGVLPHRAELLELAWAARRRERTPIARRDGFAVAC